MKTFICALHGIVPAEEVGSSMVGRREDRKVEHRHITSVCIQNKKLEILENMPPMRKIVVGLGLISGLTHAGYSARRIIGSVTVGDIN